MTAEIAEDPEVLAMAKIRAVLDPLEETARWRVLRWASERFGAGGIRVKKVSSDVGIEDSSGDSGNHFATFADFFNSTQANSGSERALVAGYWFQMIKKQSTFLGQEANSELKNLGRPLANVTVAMNTLMNRTPAYVLQVQKSGNSNQGRKKYKLTSEGINRVKAMLAGQRVESDEANE